MSDKDARMAEPDPIAMTAVDGYTIKGFVWRHSAPPDDDELRPIVIINAATSVRCGYYFRFAEYLRRHGCDAIVYDYRGIGESRPERLAWLDATWLDWGERDFEAVLRHVLIAFPGQPIDVVAHSIGGFVMGLASSNHLIRRVFTVGAQYAYWRDYAPRSRLAMLWKWHVVMPALATLCGYFPAKRLGWMEDTPKGVALSWSRSRGDFERTYRRAPIARTETQLRALARCFAGMRARVLAVSVTDDEFGTIPAIERLLRYFTHSHVVHLRISPEMAGVDRIGHFAFFHSRFETSLWPIALRWLTSGEVGPMTHGRIVSQRDALSPTDTHTAPAASAL